MNDRSSVRRLSRAAGRLRERGILFVEHCPSELGTAPPQLLAPQVRVLGATRRRARLALIERQPLRRPVLLLHLRVELEQLVVEQHRLLERAQLLAVGLEHRRRIPTRQLVLVHQFTRHRHCLHPRRCPFRGGSVHIARLLLILARISAVVLGERLLLLRAGNDLLADKKPNYPVS